MEANIIQIALTIIIVAIIGAAKFYERKFGDNPQAWDLNKFLLLVGVAIAIMAVEYSYGNAIVYPGEEVIGPALTLFGTAYAFIVGGKIVKRVAIPAITGTAPSSWKAGFTVTPAFSVGRSPYTQTFHLTSGAPAADHPGTVGFEIDWMDGTPKQVVQATTIPGQNAYAEVSHEFAYSQGDTQYTGHSFYPEFTIVSSDGSKESFNTDGKCCEIEVQA